MEGLGELVVQWPVANAMIRYVEVFVDEELAIVVGLVYWYSPSFPSHRFHIRRYD